MTDLEKEERRKRYHRLYIEFRRAVKRENCDMKNCKITKPLPATRKERRAANREALHQGRRVG